MHVDVWIEGFVISQSARADIENGRRTRGSVLEMMTVAYARREARTVTGLQKLFTRISDEHDLAFEDIHKLVFHCVPVPLTRPRARRQHEQIHSELGEAGRIAQLTAKSFAAGLIEWRRIVRAARARRPIDCNLVAHHRLASQGFEAQLYARERHPCRARRTGGCRPCAPGLSNRISERLRSSRRSQRAADADH